MKCEISVLIPVYGVEKYIEKCLHSIFNNSYADICEFILINDCTKDKSIEIAEKIIEEYPKLKKNISIINLEKNSGIGNVRNIALQNAKGKYIIFVDSDDWIENGFIEKLYSKAIETNSDITGCDWYEERNNISTVYKHNLLNSPQENLISFLKCEIPAFLWVTLIKKELISKNNISFEKGINNWEDECFMLKIFSKTSKISYIEEPLYHYLIRQNSYIRCLVNEKTKDDFLNSIKIMDDYLINNNLNEYLSYLNYKKLHIKQKLLIDGKFQMQKKYIKSFPEAIAFIKKDNTLKPRIKIILTLSFKCSLLARLILFFYSSLKIILRKQFTWKEYFSK